MSKKCNKANKGYDTTLTAKIVLSAALISLIKALVEIAARLLE